jgi:hypothetical protein
LKSRYRRNLRKEGKENPSLSATQSELQRNQAVLLQESLKIAATLQVLPSKRTGESAPLNPVGKFSGVFLWKADAQSGFSRLHQANTMRLHDDVAIFGFLPICIGVFRYVCDCSMEPEAAQTAAAR